MAENFKKANEGGIKMNTTTNTVYRGLPANYTNGECYIIAHNGMKLTPDAFWMLWEINHNIMEMTNWKEV